MKHSPTPFSHWANEKKVEILDDRGVSIAQVLRLGVSGHNTTPLPAVPNAEFIVRACNAHEDLLAAAKAALEHGSLESDITWKEVANRLRDAINKAEEAK